MKLLLDSCVWGGAVAELQTAGHDVVWSGDWEDDPAMKQSSPKPMHNVASW